MFENIYLKYHVDIIDVWTLNSIDKKYFHIYNYQKGFKFISYDELKINVKKIIINKLMGQWFLLPSMFI